MKATNPTNPTEIVGIYFVIFLCYVLIVIKWILWIPYMIFCFPFTEKYMHEYELAMYPTYWLDKLKEKL
jgi:hypothetical protein